MKNATISRMNFIISDRNTKNATTSRKNSIVLRGNIIILRRTTSSVETYPGSSIISGRNTQSAITGEIKFMILRSITRIFRGNVRLWRRQALSGSKNSTA
jgi:hypothetical protein